MSSPATTVDYECTGDETVDQAETICAPGSMTLRVNTCAFDNAKMDVDRVYLAGPEMADPMEGTGNNTCRAMLSGNFFDFSIVEALTDCGTVLTANETHLTYSNAIQCKHGMKNSVITRKSLFTVRFSCSFVREQVISSPGFLTVMRHVEVDLATVTGVFDIQMGVYDDSTFSDLVTESYEVRVPEPLHVGIKIFDEGASNMHLQLRQCWGTPDANPNNELHYIFIDDYCGDALEVNEYETLEVISNGDSSMASFVVDSFAFNDQMGELFLHCSARVCDASQEDCRPICDYNGRRRRRASSSPFFPITLGPIKVLPEK